MSSIAFWEEQPATLQAARDRAKAALVVHLVALATGERPRDILQPTRAQSAAARARWLAMYLCHVGFSLPMMRVAAAFGRDRTSVSHAIHEVENWRSEAAFDRALSALETCVACTPVELELGELGGRAS